MHNARWQHLPPLVCYAYQWRMPRDEVGKYLTVQAIYAPAWSAYDQENDVGPGAREAGKSRGISAGAANFRRRRPVRIVGWIEVHGKPVPRKGN
jgi:hypothetical protein